MKLSARNQLPGEVVSVKPGVVTGEVVVKLDNGPEVVSVITMGLIESLALAPGSRVTVIIKSTEVMLATED